MNKKFILFGIGACLGLGMKMTYAQHKTNLNTVTSTQAKTDGMEVAAQKKIDSLANERDNALNEYMSTYAQWEKLKAYNDQMEKVVKSQKEEMDSLSTQIVQIDKTDKEVIPLQLKMIEKFEELVKNDLPFLPEERSMRVGKLKGLMDRADVAYSEKYRQILEAYQVESEFGRTIESYKGSLDIEGKKYAVNFLRVGRIALMYQSLDGKIGGYWDTKGKKWVEASRSLNKQIALGIGVATKKIPVTIFGAMVPAAKVASN